MALSVEEKSMNTSQKVSRSLGEIPPSTYILKIENFPSLARSRRTEKYETRLFEVGGYKWKLLLYQEFLGSIFLYLQIEDVVSLPKDWEVFANVEFFLFNQVEDRCMVIPTENGIERFHSSKTKSFGKLGLSFQTFNDPKNGYLVNSCCTFRVKLSVINLYEKWECLSLKDKPADGRFTWKIHKFSTLDKGFIYSDEFTVGENKWKLQVYPKGDDGKDDSLSLFLTLSDHGSLPENGMVYARAKMRVLSKQGSLHVKFDDWFTKVSKSTGWGHIKFITLKDLYDKGKGFLVNDALKVQVEFEIVSATTYFPKESPNYNNASDPPMI